MPELGRDGATLRVDVPADSQGDAPDPASLDVVLSGRTLDAPAKAGPVATSVVAPQPGTTSLTPDPGLPGSHPVDTRTTSSPA